MKAFNDTYLFKPRSYRFIAAAFVLTCVLIFAGLSYYVNFMGMRFFSEEYPNWLYQEYVLNELQPEHNELIIIGDSRPRAGYDPTLINDLTSRNLALGGGSSIETYYSLKRYLQRHTADNVVISIAPYHFSTADAFWGRSMKFKFLRFAEVEELIELQSAYSEPHLRGRKISTWDYYYYYLPFAFRAELRVAFLENRLLQNRNLFKRFDLKRGQGLVGTSDFAEGISREVKYKDSPINPLLNDYLEMTLELAKTNGLKLYWYTYPLNQISCSSMSSDYMERYNGQVEALSKQYGMAVLNTLECLPNEYFGDDNHVNGPGANYATKDLINRWKLSNPKQTN